MRLPRFSTEWSMVAVTRSRFRAAVEGAVAGLSLGLIDVHSTNGDFFDATIAFLVAAFALGLRHGGRSWQAWSPLGWCFYLMHRAAIACDYRPPYVEADADAALMSLYVLWPSGVGLAFGAMLRFAIPRLSATRSTPGWTNQHQSVTGEREITQHTDPGRVPSRHPVSNSAGRMPHQRLTVIELMVIIALIGIHLAAMRAFLIHEPFLGLGTIYSERYTESRFMALRVGLSRAEVEAIMGRPLRKVPWNQHVGPHDEEMWYYSDQPNATANFCRRWVLFQNGKVVVVMNDFWVD
jgi:hypothetical protein